MASEVVCFVANTAAAEVEVDCVELLPSLTFAVLFSSCSISSAILPHFSIISGLLIALDMTSWNWSSNFPRAVHASRWGGGMDADDVDDDDDADELEFLDVLLESFWFIKMELSFVCC